MKITTLFLAGSLMIALLAGPVRIASATRHDYSADLCHSIAPSVVHIGYTFSEAYSSSTSAEYLFCPASTGQDTSSLDLTSAYVDIHDALSTDDVSCYYHAIDYYGTSYVSSTKYSCATAGGCTSGTRNTSWAGGDNYLSWTNPLNGGTAITSATQFDIVCTLPANGSTSVGVRHYKFYD